MLRFFKTEKYTTTDSIIVFYCDPDSSNMHLRKKKTTKNKTFASYYAQA